MSQPSFFVSPSQQQSRLLCFFRGLLVIPHHIVMAIWQYVVQIVTFFQWWIVLFTGKRSEGIWKMQNSWLGYATRVWSYYGLMYDQYPNFGPTQGSEPVTYSFEYTASASRLTNFFRFLMIIPAIIVAFFVMIAALLAVACAWFAILFTGKHPAGLFGFQLKVHQYMTRVSAYSMLMTDTYPKYGA